MLILWQAFVNIRLIHTSFRAAFKFPSQSFFRFLSCPSELGWLYHLIVSCLADIRTKFLMGVDAQSMSYTCHQHKQIYWIFEHLSSFLRFFPFFNNWRAWSLLYFSLKFGSNALNTTRVLLGENGCNNSCKMYE